MKTIKIYLTIEISVVIQAIVMTLIISSISSVNATGLRGDPGDDVTPEQADCFINGYDSGFAGKYDSDRARECIEHSDEYNDMWSVGCEDSLRTEEECGDLINNLVEIEDYEPLYYPNVSDCQEGGDEDGKAGRPFNKEKERGCQEFENINKGYEVGYQQGCETRTAESTCELRYEDKKYYCYVHRDVGRCTEFLHNATNKEPHRTDLGNCASQNVTCISESNPEKYRLKYGNPTFCKTIGDLCDLDGYVKPEYPYCMYN